MAMIVEAGRGYVLCFTKRGHVRGASVKRTSTELCAALEQTRGNMRRAAHLLGVCRRTVQYWVTAWDLWEWLDEVRERPRFL